MKKKINLMIAGIFMALIAYGSYTYLIGTGQDTVIKVKQVDRNGTLINSPIILAGKFLHNYDFNPQIQDYDLTNSGDLPSNFTRRNQNLTLKYNSNLNLKDVANTLNKSHLILSMAQELSTTSLGGSQKANYSSSSVARLRILTSSNGTSWQRLNVDYPNVQMRNTTPLWNGHELYVYFGKEAMYTSDFKNWKTLRWSSHFNKGRIKKQHVFSAKGKTYMLILGNTSKNKENRVYYARINTKDGTVKSKWNRITDSSLPAKLVDASVSYQDNTYYLTGTDSQGHVKVLKSTTSLNNWKQSGVVLTSKRYAYQAAQIISTKNRLLMCYTLVDRKTGFSDGMMYRAFLKNNSSFSKQKKADIDFTTHDFSVR